MSLTNVPTVSVHELRNPAARRGCDMLRVRFFLISETEVVVIHEQADYGHSERMSREDARRVYAAELARGYEVSTCLSPRLLRDSVGGGYYAALPLPV